MVSLRASRIHINFRKLNTNPCSQIMCTGHHFILFQITCELNVISFISSLHDITCRTESSALEPCQDGAARLYWSNSSSVSWDINKGCMGFSGIKKYLLDFVTKPAPAKYLVSFALIGAKIIRSVTKGAETIQQHFYRLLCSRFVHAFLTLSQRFVISNYLCTSKNDLGINTIQKS